MPKLTAKAVEAIKPAANRQEIPDTLLPGLYLIVQPSGARSWAVRYRHGGLTRKHTLGPFPRLDLKSARDLGAKALRDAAAGTDPAAEKKRAGQPESVEAVAAQFIEKHCKRNYRPRTLAEAERLLRLYVVGRWGRRPISSITRSDVRDMLDKLIAQGAPVTANRAFSLARKFFNWAVEHEIVAMSPCASLRPPTVEATRDRVLTDSELRRVWQAADTMGGPFGALVKLLIATGQRRGEIAGLMWPEIDLDKRLICFPRERVKNNRAHDIPLNAQAISVIREAPRISDRFVFALNSDGPINGFSKNKTQLDTLLPTDMQPWTLHDIRRTVASGMARLGIALPVIEKVLNHVSGSFAGIVGIYQRHDFAAEKRAALDTWGKHVAAIVSDKGGRR
jgi:integrase